MSQYLRYRKSLDIRWADLDPNFHVLHSKYYDFGAYCRMSFMTENGLDPAFLKSIYDLGEENRQADHLRTMRGQRGSADTIYVNRAFFGLYSLLGRLRARVKVDLPSWITA